MKEIAVVLRVGVLALIILIVVSFIFAVPVYLLWNWLMPQIFGLKEITYFQAWGINLLVGILIGDHKK